MNPVLLGIAAYIVAQLVIGVAVSRKITGESDYFLAGRSLGYTLATFSMFATWFGAETVIGAASDAYQHGVSLGTAEPFAYAMCLFLMGWVFAVPLWNRQLFTLADLFRTRYSPLVERTAAIIMVPTTLLWAGAQIRAFGQVIASSSSVGVEAAIGAAALVVIIYTVSGGLFADAVTDLVQGIALIVGLVWVAYAVVDGAGGPAAFGADLELDSLTLWPDGMSVLDVVEAWSIPVFGSIVAQELAARVLASRSPAVARRSSYLGGGLYLLLGIIPLILGLAAGKLLGKIDDPEQVLPLLAQSRLSTAFYVLFAGALVSAILSTVDSCLLTASSLVTHNLVAPLRPGLTEEAKLRLARYGVAGFGVAAYALAVTSDNVFAMVEEASALGSAGLFVILAAGLFTRFGGALSAMSALLTGTAVWMIASRVAAAHHPYLLSLASAAAAYALAGLLDRKREAAQGAPASEPQSEPATI